MRFFNTLTGQKEDFTPITPETVKMYVCGPTVYDRAHLGNARPAVVFDVLFRLLQREYRNVIYVRNFTDIDDKIIDRAREIGTTMEALTQHMERKYLEDMARLGVLWPTHMPRATEHIPDILRFIEKIMNAGYAYSTRDGHVFYKVKFYEEFKEIAGKLSKRGDNKDTIARIDAHGSKSDNRDFVLWKPSADDQPGWDSPWGRGRPGWHIECSAMSTRYLGERFDIHGGGSDLIFPHHENEIAQNVAAHAHEDAQASFWMHNGMLLVDGKKMAKSAGNFTTIDDISLDFDGEDIRFYFLHTHYRGEFDWKWDDLLSARKKIQGWYKELLNVQTHEEAVEHHVDYIMDALEDDLNTPLAITRMQEIADSGDWASVREAGKVLGILEQPPLAYLQRNLQEVINPLIEQRNKAKEEKDYDTADRIRDQLEKFDVVVEDSKNGTFWYFK